MRGRFAEFYKCIMIAVLLVGCPRGAAADAQLAISTRAGLISRVRGQVFIKRAASESSERASADLQLMDGDRLTTEVMGRAELLVNSVAYLCLDEQSALRAVNTILTEARFELLRGTFMIQAGSSALLRNGPGSPRSQKKANRMNEALAFEIATPHGNLTILEDGLYRISIETSDTRIDVYEGGLALGGRAEAAARTARKITGPKRLRLTGNPQMSQAIAELKLKPYDRFDHWRFPITNYGVATRVEGRVIASSAPDGSDWQRVAPEFQLRAGQVLSTEPSSHVQLMTSFDTSVSLDHHSRIRAVETESEETVIELLVGAVFASTSARYPIRPMKIETPQGTFAINPGTLARIDMDARETVIRVWGGKVKSGSVTIAANRQLRLRNGSPLLLEKVTAVKDGFDAFERWSTGLLGAGAVMRHEGKVILERDGGARLELEDHPPELRAHLLEGGHMSTESGGRAALNFGAHAIHINENSEIVAVSSSAKMREFQVARGSAIVYTDSPRALYSTTKVTISTPQGVAELSNGGIFRFDVDSSGTRITVRSGSLRVAPHAEAAAKVMVKVKENQTATLKAGAGAPQVSRSTDATDDFDQWSIAAREITLPEFVTIRR